jgi:uncharacterized OsmC-like protein
MRSAARITSAKDSNQILLTSGKRSTSLVIPPKESGFGSSASGGELLMLALATCYCNDVYREAALMGIEVTGIEVESSAEFPKEGQPASEITYSARIAAKAPEAQIRELAMRTDQRAEIHATVRQAIEVGLTRVDTLRV